MKKENLLNKEVFRQSFHLLGGLIFIAVLQFFSVFETLLFAVAFFLAILVVSLLLSLEFHVPVLKEIVKAVGRLDESSLPAKGALVFVAGIIFVLLFYSLQSKEIALGAILLLSFGDFASTLFGIKFGKTFLAKNRSIEGSIAGIAIGFAVLLFLFNPLKAFLVAFFGMLAEYLPLNDNFGIPIVAGLAIMLL